MSHSLIGRIFGVFAVLVFCMGCATDVYGVLSANRHAYAVTNKRIFILNDFLMPLARPMPPEDIDFVALVQHDGRGTITLQHAPGLRFYKIGLCALKEQFLPQKIMNAPNAEGAIKPLNALLQIKKDREADAPKTLNVNQRLVEPMSRV